tara:strand:- start:579 stop:839 length:261 start_codon:yes stop_codon:yes gene_type:complete
MTGQEQTSRVLKIGGKGIACVFILILGLVFMTDLETGKLIGIGIGSFALYIIGLALQHLYKAYKKNGWDDPVFKNNENGGGEFDNF